MKTIKFLGGKLGIVLGSALLGCTTYGQPSVSVGVSVPVPSVSVGLPSVEIHAESDFYEPLAPQGEWVVVGSYGRCWRPGHVARDWRPYCNGNWERTDAGWYWVSDEPWAWATYHYGRWNYTDQYGWYWMPQTQWAPAWVSWHEGGGYIGWAPLYPSGVRIISPRAYVFVEQRQFLEPIRPGIVVVNNTTIINKTVINRGPAPAEIERFSGRKIAAVSVRELRQKQEAPVAARQHTSAAAREKTGQTPGAQPPGRNQAGPGERKPDVTPARPQSERPVATSPEFTAPAPKNRDTQSEKRQPASVAPEARPEINHSPAAREPAPPKADKRTDQRTDQPDKPARENSGASDQGGPADKEHGKKNNE